jgi:hypothetical protein
VIDQLLDVLNKSIALTDLKEMREFLKGAEGLRDNMADQEFYGMDYGHRERIDSIGNSLNVLICELNAIIREVEETAD